MNTSRFLIGSATAAITAVMLPVSALAYLSPEQVFQGLKPPPTQRETEDIVKDRQRQTADERRAAQEALPSTEDEPVADEGDQLLMPSAGEEDAQAPSLMDDEGQWQRRKERLDQNDNGTTTIIINGDSGQVIRDRRTGQILHSGAPRMSGTGPAEYMAAGVLFLAASGTFAYMKRREKKLLVH